MAGYRTDGWMSLRPPNASSDGQRFPASMDKSSFLAMAMSTEAVSQANVLHCQNQRRAMSRLGVYRQATSQPPPLAACEPQSAGNPGLAENSFPVTRSNVVGGKALLSRTAIDTLSSFRIRIGPMTGVSCVSCQMAEEMTWCHEIWPVAALPHERNLFCG